MKNVRLNKLMRILCWRMDVWPYRIHHNWRNTKSFSYVFQYTHSQSYSEYWHVTFLEILQRAELNIDFNCIFIYPFKSGILSFKKKKKKKNLENLKKEKLPYALHSK